MTEHPRSRPTGREREPGPPPEHRTACGGPVPPDPGERVRPVPGDPWDLAPGQSWGPLGGFGAPGPGHRPAPEPPEGAAPGRRADDHHPLPDLDGVSDALALLAPRGSTGAPCPGGEAAPGASASGSPAPGDAPHPESSPHEPSSPKTPPHRPDARPPAPDRPAAAGTSAAPPAGETSPRRPARGHVSGAPAWTEARAIAAREGRRAPGGTRTAPLADALGHVLAEPLTALCDLPSFDTSAMDGWAVSGPGPWHIQDAAVLAGHAVADALADGTAVRIATGARVPRETTAVIRSEHARADEAKGLLHAERTVVPGQDIRPRAQECRSGERLLGAGTAVTPAVLGLAAAAGYDELRTVRPVRAEILVLGDELLPSGLPREGLIRDALGPMVGPWLRALGAGSVTTRRIVDDEEALHRAVADSEAELLVTTGGTAAGPVDHVRPVLLRLGAHLLVEGVAVRPGHPMLLARLAPGRCLVGLPGNPLAAVSALLTLAEPLLRGFTGRPTAEPSRIPVHESVQGHPHDTRLVPVRHTTGRLVPLRYHGPAMLRGIAGADALAVVPPGGARPGDALEVLGLPWTSWAHPGTEEGCST